MAEESRYYRLGKDKYFLNIALEVAKRSTCIRRKYGCVIVSKEGRIIATGFNGSPSGFLNCTDTRKCFREKAERYTNYEDCVAIHAEQNALTMANFQSMKEGKVYLACLAWDSKELLWKIDKNPLPCFICRKMLQNSGLKLFRNMLQEIDIDNLKNAIQTEERDVIC